MRYLAQHFLSDSAVKRPDSLFVQCRERRLTYGEADVLTNRLADLLAAVGVGRHDRVCFYLRGLWMPSSPLSASSRPAASTLR